ncbi:MAG TPA: hypothetical protein VFT91_03600 [Dehalococcoidia bacterium]|nr:hypothetical protein [Dehalococcoidia bacterium]
MEIARARPIGSQARATAVDTTLALAPWGYVGLLLVSWALFVLAVRETGPVVIQWPALLGLLSYLHWTYWVGLGVLLGTALLVYLDRSLESNFLFVAIALSVGIYILGLTVFLEPNARTPASYGNFVEVRVLQHAGRLNFAEPLAASSYRNWPGSLFLLHAVMQVTGVNNYVDLTRFLPLAWPFILVAITQALGRTLRLAPRQTFLLSLLPLATTLGWHDYLSTFLGEILFLLAVTLLLDPDRGVATTFMLIILAFALVITHPVISLALLLTAVALMVTRGTSSTFPLLLLTLLGVWHVYAALSFTDYFLNDFLGTLWRPVVAGQFQSSSYETVGPVSEARLASRYAGAAFFSLYALLALWGAVWFVRHRREGAQAQMVGKVLLMAAALAPIAISVGLGAEGLARTLVLGAPLIVLALALTRPSKALAGLLLVGLPVLLLFAQYSLEGIWPYVGTSSLRGSDFFATRVERPPPSFFAYHGVHDLVTYYNPAYLPALSVDSWSVTDLGLRNARQSQLEHVSYLLFNQQGHDTMRWVWGFDPFWSWRQTSGAQRADLIYDNGPFEIYRNAGD